MWTRSSFGWPTSVSSRGTPTARAKLQQAGSLAPYCIVAHQQVSRKGPQQESARHEAAQRTGFRRLHLVVPHSPDFCLRVGSLQKQEAAFSAAIFRKSLSHPVGTAPAKDRPVTALAPDTLPECIALEISTGRRRVARCARASDASLDDQGRRRDVARRSRCRTNPPAAAEGGDTPSISYGCETSRTTGGRTWSLRTMASRFRRRHHGDLHPGATMHGSDPDRHDGGCRPSRPLFGARRCR